MCKSLVSITSLKRYPFVKGFFTSSIHCYYYLHGYQALDSHRKQNLFESDTFPQENKELSCNQQLRLEIQRTDGGKGRHRKAQLPTLILAAKQQTLIHNSAAADTS